MTITKTPVRLERTQVAARKRPARATANKIHAGDSSRREPGLNRFGFSGTIILFLMTLLLVVSSLWLGNSKSIKLPGARPVIQAAEYASLQAAIDALPTKGGIVQLPPGEFTISQPLVVHGEDVAIVGSGTATHIKNVNEEGADALVLTHPDYKKNKKLRRWRVRLANFRITGNKKSGHGIHALGINEIYVDGVTISYHGKDGLRLDHCYEDPRIADCLITYNEAIGVNLIGCHDIVVSATQFEENQDALVCTDGFNLTMTGNNLDDHTRHGVIIENTYGSVVAGNMIEECRGTAIILDRDCYGIALSANVIAHNGSGIDLRDAHGCSVSANTLTIMKKDALRIAAECAGIAVTGNSICDSTIGPNKLRRLPNDQLAAGVVLDGGSDVTITGNQFSGLRPYAIEAKKASRRVIISSNVFSDSKNDEAKLEKALRASNIESE